jgi:hypothetical protein
VAVPASVSATYITPPVGRGRDPRPSAGIPFTRTANGVWLVNARPPEDLAGINGE